MKQILKILKKYTFWIVLVIILLLIQAYCDLKLPDYTSNIINVGIQSAGIESSIPEVITEKSMNELLLFIEDETDPKILSKYTLIEKGESRYIEEYPSLENENIYVLNKISKEEKEQLKEKLTLPMAITYYIGQMDNQKASGQMMLQGTEQEINQMIESFKSQYEEVDSSILEQAAKAYLQEEYKQVGIDLEKMQISYIAITGLKMIALAAIIMAVTIATSFLASKIAANFTADLRTKVVSKVMDFSSAEFINLSTSSLITRCTNDIQQVQMLLVMLLRMVLYAPIIGIGALTKLAGTTLGGVVAVAILAIIGFIILILVVAMPKFQKIQKIIDKINMIAREILNGLPVIRAFATEEHEEERFDIANTDLTKTQLFTRRVMAGLMPYLTFVMNAASVAIIWFASKQIDLGTMQVGNMTAILTYTMQIITSFLMLSMISIMGPRAMVSAKRIAEVLNKEISIENKSENELKKFDDNTKGIIEFKNVTFQYPDGEEPMLEDISFVTKPGTTTAFIGPTGSGKSTLVNLIPRFYDVTKGQILIDGVDVRDVSLQDLRNKIGFVPQKGLLFSGTIESNIKFGDENLNDADMKKAAEISCAKGFVEDKQEQYNSVISQGGTNVSGGQRQRLSIARAVAIKPEFYVFDDSFSALDYKTDSQVRKNIAKEINDATILIVAQRISTIMHADQIIVLEDGKIVGKGTHKELLENCKTYQEIASSQLSEKEIEDSKKENLEK